MIAAIDARKSTEQSGVADEQTSVARQDEHLDAGRATKGRHPHRKHKPRRQSGRELVDLLTELSADGNVTREEMDRLRAWLEVDRSVDFPAMPFFTKPSTRFRRTVRLLRTNLICWLSRLNGYYRRTYGRLRQPSARSAAVRRVAHARWPVRR